MANNFDFKNTTDEKNLAVLSEKFQLTSDILSAISYFASQLSFDDIDDCLETVRCTLVSYANDKERAINGDYDDI